MTLWGLLVSICKCY